MLQQVERILAGTPLEPVARRVWAEVRSLGRPRARQSLSYDKSTEQIMARILRPDSNCVDIGAHRGSVLATICKLAPRGRHFAFEPIPGLAADLKGRFPGVDVRELALSDAKGVRTFCHVVNSQGKSGFRKLNHVGASAKVMELVVKTDMLDNCIPDHLRIDFMKVDVEGAQLEVFMGASRIIEGSRPSIVFEHGMLAKEGYGTTSEMIYHLLVEDYGLRISLLAAWLAGRPSLSADEFNQHVGYHPGSDFCFLAHP